MRKFLKVFDAFLMCKFFKNFYNFYGLVNGAPMVMSRPHFLDSNVNINEKGEEIIEGLNPDTQKHDFHMDIFPVSNANRTALIKFNQRTL